jgi:hypothetical protein
VAKSTTLDFVIFLGQCKTSPLAMSACLFYQLQMIDDDEYGAFDGTKVLVKNLH